MRKEWHFNGKGIYRRLRLILPITNFSDFISQATRKRIFASVINIISGVFYQNVSFLDKWKVGPMALQKGGRKSLS